MNKVTMIVLVLIAMTIKTNAQIPNNGFENWGTYSDFAPPYIAYANPNGWYGALGTNPADTGYSIHKNLDNYPSGTGLFSVMITSDIGKGVIGLARTSNQSQPAPAFPITGHPTSLTGYYKFLPQNGDTMNINVVLFHSGAIVAGGTSKGTATISNWTSFNVPISSYTTADSAFISLASCNLNGGLPVPQGNSALYIDNLNFDVLITTGISEVNDLPAHFNLNQNFPNPFNPSTIIQFTVPSNGRAVLKVFNTLGQEVATLFNNNAEAGIYHQVQFDAANLASGIYFSQLEFGGKVAVKKMLLLK